MLPPAVFCGKKMAAVDFFRKTRYAYTDDSIEYGVHISHLLREIVPEEEAKGETEE